MGEKPQKKAKSTYNYVLEEVYYSNNNRIEKIKYYSTFENKYFEMTFALYYNKFRNVLPFRNAILVSSNVEGVVYFRARTHRDIGSFQKIGGYDGTDFDSTPTQPQIKGRSINGRGCSSVSRGNETENGAKRTSDNGRANGSSVFQRGFEQRYAKSTDSSFGVRNVRKAEKVSPQVFKGLFRKARNNLEPDVRWFVSIRKVDELKKFDCLVFNDNIGGTEYPVGYIAINPVTGDMGALLRDKACELPHFTLQAFANALLHGGNKLDCYSYPNKGLGYVYAKHGCMPVCRVRFDDSKSERAVRKNVGRPDIVMFFVIDAARPADYIETYVNKVETEAYPAYNEYKFIPYVDELPEWYQYGYSQGLDEYQTGLYIRDKMLEKWIALRDNYIGRECEFVYDMLYQYFVPCEKERK